MALSLAKRARGAPPAATRTWAGGPGDGTAPAATLGGIPASPGLTSERMLDLCGCFDQAAPALGPDDRDLIVQYLVLRALTRIQAAAPAPPPATARRRIRCRPRPRSRHER